MNQFEGLLLLAGLSAGLLLAGYWLAVLLDEATPATRLAAALLAGLGSLLFAVSAVNFFVPLTRGWAVLCLAPIGVTLLRRECRVRLCQDLAAVGRSPGAPLLAGLGLVFLAALLWPILSDGQRVFYDGTSNHDSFFWISGAEHLKRHAYMVAPVPSPTQPLTNNVAALTGWTPIWGRMGAEGLLALASSLAWTSPLKLYIYATACLFLPWLSAVFLAVRTFGAERLSLGAKVVLVIAQPLFVFFYSNANLPNLLGALTGAAVVIATEQVLRSTPGAPGSGRGWWGLLVLSLHGLMCSYPEMIPFVLLPCGLLWLRPWFRPRGGSAGRAGLRVAAAFAAGIVLNPVTTIRAASGFAASFEAARANQIWSNLFEPLTLSQYLPALGTLSVPASHFLRHSPAALMTLAIFVSLALAWWRASDRLGSVFAFAGGIALAVYTALTGFNYGWQKTAQFSGVFVAAIAVAAFEAQRAPGLPKGRRLRLVRGAVGLTVAFLVFAVAMNCRNIASFASRKVISQDWFLLRDISRGPLRDAPVLIEAGSFDMGFFYSMWATYFLPDSRLYFGARGDESGGYLHKDIIREGRRPVPQPKAILVGREWADSFDADSPRLEAGREFALLRASNRMLAMEGVYPLYGVPEFSSTSARFEILPHAAGVLTFGLKPRQRGAWTTGTWKVDRHAEGAPDFSTLVSGAPPWRINVPLVVGQPNRITVRFATYDNSLESYPFNLGDPRIVAEP